LPDDFLRLFCVIGTPDECIEPLRQLIGLGLSHLVVGGSRDIDVVAVPERSEDGAAFENRLRYAPRSFSFIISIGQRSIMVGFMGCVEVDLGRYSVGGFRDA
jgi:hypothetical protein